MKKLLLLIPIFIGCIVTNCTNITEEELINSVPKTKSHSDSVTNDSTGIEIKIKEWDTTNINTDF